MDANDIVQYIDEWLKENSYRVDARVIDFALDVRLMVSQLTAEERAEEPALV